MTDSMFSDAERAQARWLLEPKAGDKVDAAVRAAEQMAEQGRMSLIYSATMLNMILTDLPGEPTVADALASLGDIFEPVVFRRKIIVVAPSYNQAAEYLREIHAPPGSHLIAMEPHMVRGLGPEDHVVVVGADFDPHGRLRAYADYLIMTQARVTSISLDHLKGVFRDR